MTPHSREGAVTTMLRRLALPLAAYYAVTLAVPLANGAQGGGFVDHALVVLVVPVVLVALACAASFVLRAAAVCRRR